MKIKGNVPILATLIIKYLLCFAFPCFVGSVSGLGTRREVRESFSFFCYGNICAYKNGL